MAKMYVLLGLDYFKTDTDFILVFVNNARGYYYRKKRKKAYS